MTEVAPPQPWPLRPFVLPDGPLEVPMPSAVLWPEKVPIEALALLAQVLRKHVLAS